MQDAGTQAIAESDVAMFSFGVIKTATALGGAVLRFREAALRERVAAHMAAWPRQPRIEFVRRLARFAVLKILSWRPLFTTVFALLAAGGRADAVLNASARGFAGADFFARIRRRPSVSLQRLLARRLAEDSAARIAARAERGARFAAQLPATVRIGAAAAHHTHWICPVRSRDPAGLIARLRTAGFDATQGASNMESIAPTDGEPVINALHDVVYLPAHAGASGGDLDRLVDCIVAADGHRAAPAR